jgi:hypothetical protein
MNAPASGHGASAAGRSVSVSAVDFSTSPCSPDYGLRYDAVA